MAVNLSPLGGVGAQFFDSNGNPLSGGLIYTYAAGTSTPAATYTSSSGLIQHSNPIVLDAAGRVPTGEIWLTDGISYKFTIKTSADVLVNTYDNIVGINSNFIAYTAQQEIQTATAGQTVFTLTTMQYQPATNNLSVFVDGVNQYGSGAQYAYVETDSDTVTFVSGLHVGASVKFTTASPVSSSSTNAADVSYDPPFTGSVATNVADKLAQTVSVKDFGAVGDGVTDDTDAIQAAIDSCLEESKTLFVPEGNYVVTSSLLINGTRGTGNQVTFRMVGEIASDAITQGNGVIESRTNIIFDVSASKLFDIQFDDAHFQNVSFEDFSIRQTKDSAYFRTSEGFSVGKSTTNYVQKLLWQNVNCYGMKNFIRFYCTTGNPASSTNYFGPTYIDRCNVFKTETCVELDNVNMNLIYLDRNLFHDTTVSGGIHIKGSSTLMNIRNTHFEGCEPAGIYQSNSNWNVSLGLDNVSAENTGVDSGYGLLQAYTPGFGYSVLRVFVSNTLYPSAFMPPEIRLPFGAQISSQCPIKVSGSGWIANTPETIIPVVSDDSTYGQTDTSTFFIVKSLSTSVGRTGQKIIEKSIAGSNAGVGKSPVSGNLPTGIKEKCVGIDADLLINNNSSEGFTASYDGYVYGSFAGQFTATNNGFNYATYLIGGSDIGIQTGYTWEPFVGTVVFMAPISNGQSITTMSISVFQSDWRTPLFMSAEPNLITAAQAATIYPKLNRWDTSIATGATSTYQVYGELNKEFSLRVRFSFNAGASGIYEYLVRGHGTTASIVYVNTINSLPAGITVAVNGFPSNENLYKIDVTNTTGSTVAVTIENEYLS